jgi:lipoprotein-releasing system ATP-binding protein
MSDAVLELSHVRKSYGATQSTESHAGTEVLHGIDLRIGPRDFAALIGPSGSGKSTLLNILGLLDRPTSGEVWVQGTPVARMNDDEMTRARNQTLGFVFQFHHLLPGLSVIENVALPLTVRRGASHPQDLEQAHTVLKSMELGELATRPSGSLSGGQQQRVAIARALVHRPSLVLADEPTGNLDTTSAGVAFDLMRTFHQTHGVAFLIVTHDLRLARRCDRIIEIVDGNIQSDRVAPTPH